MVASPSAVVIHSYQVGFGDCFLLSFEYDAGEAKHVLIDFGSTGLPKGVTQSRMMEIALDIKKRTGGKLAAVVATHRHKDHISGFATAKNGKGTGDVIASLKPDLVIQPWTEDPALDREATGPREKISSAGKRVSALLAMHELAALALGEVRRSKRSLPKELQPQLSFLGEDNIKNKSAVVNLMTMAKNNYVCAGKSAGFAKILPGVKVHVLGPPTVDQAETIKHQRHEDPDEFWHLQARAMTAHGGAGSSEPLFPRHVRSRSSFPVETRWLIYHARKLRGEQLLQIVRMLDDAMNNTSVILVFEVGKTSLLFPGDAQIENWQYALDQKEYTDLLKGIRLYKVGHHGSLNATPKSLWKLFRHRTTNENATKRLISLMSTMEGKHGSEENNTEVPRSKLVSALAAESDHFSTQELKGKALSHETRIEF